MSVFIAVLLVSAQAAAGQPATPPAQAAAPTPAAKPAKEKKICKVDDADSGSHMARRTCRTVEEWNRQNLGTSRSGISISGEAMQSH